MVGEAPPITPRQKLEDLIRLAELCVDLLRQNEEFYAEVDYLNFLIDDFHIFSLHYVEFYIVYITYQGIYKN